MNSDEYLNVDLLLEEAMHALVTSPLTSSLSQSLRQHLTETKSGVLPQDQIGDGELVNLPQESIDAFKDCLNQMRCTISPLDKLAHMLTGLKVITNAVS